MKIVSGARLLTAFSCFFAFSSSLFLWGEIIHSLKYLLFFCLFVCLPPNYTELVWNLMILSPDYTELVWNLMILSASSKLKATILANKFLFESNAAQPARSPAPHLSPRCLQGAVSVGRPCSQSRHSPADTYGSLNSPPLHSLWFLQRLVISAAP